MGFATAANAGVAMAGKVVSVEGNVLVRQDGNSGGRAQAMRPGLDVKEGDVINTASDGKAKIMLEDKTILDIGPSALFKVEKYAANHGGDRNVGLSMPYGTTRVAVSKPIGAGGKFQIRTRTATMGVRGTEFIVQSEMGATIAAAIGGPSKEKSGGNAKSGASEKSETKVTVIQGKVEVAQTKTQAEKKDGEARKPAAAPAMLTAGMQITASSDAPVEKPVTLNAAQISQVSAATTVTDNTFSNAVTLDVSSNSGGGGGGSGGGGASDSGAGAATREAISVAIAAPQNQIVAGSSNAGFIGTFSPNVVTVQPQVFIPPGGALGSFKVHVVVTQ